MRPHPCGPLVAPLTDFSRLYMSIYPKNIGEQNRSGVPPLQASVATKNQSRPCSGTLPEGGIIIGGYLHQDRAKSRTRERERDQTHSYWYIPSTPRVNFSLPVMESAGMMKMATGEGSPLRQGAETGSRLVFGGYRGLQRRNSRSMVF